MNEAPVGEIQINREDIVRALLQATETIAPPTRPEKIADYLRLHIKTFRSGELGLSDDVRAYLWPAQREIGVHENLSPTRRAFSILHEIGHFVIPGHMSPVTGSSKITDKAEDLSVDSVIQQEIEANQFAADCLFQLERFDRTIFSAKLDWLNVQVVAHNYQASIEATARRWVERTTDEYALVVLNPLKRGEGVTLSPLEILYTVASKSFSQKFFSRLIPGFQFGPDTLAYRVFHGQEFRDRPEDILSVKMPSGESLQFRMQLFSNSFRMFGLLTPKD